MVTIENNILNQFLVNKYGFPEINIVSYKEYKYGVSVDYKFVETQSECTSTISYIELVNYLAEQLSTQTNKTDLFESEVID